MKMKITKLSQLEHGMKVKFITKTGKKKVYGQISIINNGTSKSLFICHNEIENKGLECSDLFGYKYSYFIGNISNNISDILGYPDYISAYTASIFSELEKVGEEEIKKIESEKPNSKFETRICRYETDDVIPPRAIYLSTQIERYTESQSSIGGSKISDEKIKKEYHYFLVDIIE